MKLWGGRFGKATDGLVDDFHSSISFDQRLFEQDILGSMAHATMLGEQGIIPAADAEKILEGLRGILEDARAGKIQWMVDAEDIHMNVETLLTERIGEAGKRLHTGDGNAAGGTAGSHSGYSAGKSAYDYARLHPPAEGSADYAGASLYGVCADVFAGPGALSARLPLGGCHGAGFRSPGGDDLSSESSACGGASGFQRCFRKQPGWGLGPVLDYLSAASICMMHLSRFCEELILWNTNEFRFVEMDDAFATGSSIMPQKKNPDVAELIRGKTGRVYGDLFTLLTVMKGLPLAYNKDMQEDKEAFFDARDTLVKGLTVFTAMLKTVTFRKDVMERGASGGFTNATDCADYLVRKGVAFRDAHKVVGELVAYCLNENKALLDLTLPELQRFHPAFGQDVFDDLSMISCVERRKIPGAPAPEMVQRSIDSARERLRNGRS